MFHVLHSACLSHVWLRLRQQLRRHNRNLTYSILNRSRTCATYLYLYIQHPLNTTSRNAAPALTELHHIRQSHHSRPTRKEYISLPGVLQPLLTFTATVFLSNPKIHLYPNFCGTVEIYCGYRYACNHILQQISTLIVYLYFIQVFLSLLFIA